MTQVTTWCEPRFIKRNHRQRARAAAVRNCVRAESACADAIKHLNNVTRRRSEISTRMAKKARRAARTSVRSALAVACAHTVQCVQTMNSTLRACLKRCQHDAPVSPLASSSTAADTGHHRASSRPVRLDPDSRPTRFNCAPAVPHRRRLSRRSPTRRARGVNVPLRWEKAYERFGRHFPHGPRLLIRYRRYRRFLRLFRRCFIRSEERTSTVIPSAHPRPVAAAKPATPAQPWTPPATPAACAPRCPPANVPCPSR